MPVVLIIQSGDTGRRLSIEVALELPVKLHTVRILIPQKVLSSFPALSSEVRTKVLLGKIEQNPIEPNILV